MAIPQAKLREIVFQLLYSHDTGRTDELSSISLLMKELQVARSGVYQAMIKANAIQQNLHEIDAVITDAVHGYTFDRIQVVERNILRLGVFELTIEKTAPPKVSISEAMRLGRKFASPESANFINAILDNIHKQMIGENPKLDALEQSVKEMEAKEKITPPLNYSELCKSDGIDGSENINDKILDDEKLDLKDLDEKKFKPLNNSY
ncbi:MAG: transcription antitermination factor NusB [Parachlamydiaceae bacterium]|nr:transcription antitermination factor NusB [Parachlamydiaceae bacterium]